MRASFGHMERPDNHETRPTVEKVLQVGNLLMIKTIELNFLTIHFIPTESTFFVLFELLLLFTFMFNHLNFG